MHVAVAKFGMKLRYESWFSLSLLGIIYSTFTGPLYDVTYEM